MSENQALARLTRVMKQETLSRSQPAFGHFEHIVTHDYRQTARNLGVPPEQVLSSIDKGLLPATRVAKGTILVGNRDLLVFLRRYSDYKKANALDGIPVWRDADKLVQSAERYLARCERVEREAQERAFQKAGGRV